MYHTKLKPDFRRLENYLPDLTNDTIASLEASEGVDCYLEYMSEPGYNRFSEELKIIAERYHISDHYNELLFLILKKNEQIRERYDAYWDNYNDDQTSKEVANFLLAYKESNEKHDFHLVAKPVTGSVAVKDSAIARWMCEQIYQAIETKKFPLGLFGTKILSDLFGDDFDNPETEISMEKLKATANLKPKKPTLRTNRMLVEFCKHIQVYLITRTELTATDDVLLTDVQAKFFFDILESIGYFNRDNIASEPKDYMHAMFRNTLAK